MADQCPISVLVLSGTFYFGSFRDIPIAIWGGPLLYTEGNFWGSRPLCDDLYSVLFRVTQYAIHQFCQTIYYTRGSRSYDCQICYICILYLHTLLTECCTHVYSYITDDTVDVWDGGMTLTFGPWPVYMSILKLWFSDRQFCTYFDCTFWVCMHERPIEYEIMYTYTSYYIYIYEWSFPYVFNDLKSFKLSAFSRSNTFGSH